jgi:hypothetical protein
MAALVLLVICVVTVLAEATAASTASPAPTDSSFVSAHAAWCAQRGFSEWRPPAASSFGATCHRRRVVVWSVGRGDYFMTAFTRIVEAGFPGSEVLWSNRPRLHCLPGTLPVGVASVFLLEQPWDLPAHFPVVLWSAERERIMRVQHGSAPIAGVSTTLDPPLVQFEHFLPYVLVRNDWLLHVTVPPSLRLYDDDINARRYAVCYINSNCVPAREHLFGRLRQLLGDDHVFAGGKCWGGPEYGPPFRPKHSIETGCLGEDDLVFTMSRCKLVIAVENEDLPGYVTEKLLNAALAGAVPIQGGGADVAPKLFNAEAFVSLHAYDSVEHAAVAIAAIAKNESALKGAV